MEQVDAEIMEKLQAYKMHDEYKYLLLTANPDVYANDIELHLTAKECAIVAVEIVMDAHTVKKDDAKKEFWLNVKQELLEL